ncbi:helix-turn-helix domain-containing protein [Nocardiopsis potens]|uniref:helix-turn-helix domain-containing protein n=1 Tax=Nocardiopsis potens TaxID=1246458 RepID=UPI00035ECE1F|nr:helix-turn-helix transcriptional regulator [Nocardiopsis potens]
MTSTEDAAHGFGDDLRRFRRQSGFSQQQLADAIPMSQSMISDIERGRVAPKWEHVERIDRVLTTRGRVAASWKLRFNAHQVPPWVKEVSQLEQRAACIRDYHPLVVPGLLQTEAYARATIRAGNMNATPEQVNALVASRLERQRILASPAAPRYTAVIDETVLLRPTGGEQVMKEQIDHLVAASSSERTEVLTVPLKTKMHPGLDGPFRLLSVPDLGDVLWREVRRAGGPVENPDHVAEHVSLFADILGSALPAEESLSLMKQIRGELP